jgi:transglutaminase-like putative cysteine protease
VPPSVPIRAEVGCALEFWVDHHATLALQVAVASTAGDREVEELAVLLDGDPVEVTELAVDHGGRIHIVEVGAGHLTVAYRAVVHPAVAEPVAPDPVESFVALRQSRYCPSDVMDGFAELELGSLPDEPGRGRAIGEWVHRRLRYEAGSGPLDTAVDTLLSGRGVCRDFAHLTLTLCRAVGVPARLAAVYAPGLFPMDFHAVAEVAAGGVWEVVDATRLAPRPSLLRIATGRDAADTAFATTIDGSVQLTSFDVTAFTDADLGTDDHSGPALLA